MAEFRISSLRYNYVGIWATGETYKIDDIVYFEGQLYTCNIPHTATNFNTDFNSVGQIDAVDFPYWTKSVNGTYYKYNWASTQTYNLNNVVKYGGAIWLCNTYHVSGSTFDSTKFTLMIEGADWSNVWTVSTAYGVGDVVRYGGIVYSCNTNHLSASSVVQGLENDQSKWTAIYKGIDYKGNWTSATVYKLNDVVKLNSTLYICVTPHVAGSTFASINFEAWLVGLEFLGQWSNSADYQLNDVVIFGGNAWYSIQNSNFNNPPDAISAFWNVLNPSYNIKTTPWSFASNYRVGDVVNYRGKLFKAVANSTGNNPFLTSPPNSYLTTSIVASGSGINFIEVDDVSNIQVGFSVASPDIYDPMNLSEYRVIKIIGNVVYFDKPFAKAFNDPGFDGDDISFQGWNYQYWQLLSSASNYRGFWDPNFASYTTGDLVVYKNNTWRCVVTHASSSDYPPPSVGAVELNGAVWTVHYPHAQQNALINQGDMVYNNVNGKDERTNLEIGPETWQIQSNQGIPTYNRILTSPNVYYVALDGLDDPDYGVTWDQPWRTIQYAVQNAVAPGTIFIKNGTYEETLPITVPEYIGLVGDELRGVVVRPATIIDTFVYQSTSSNVLKTYSTEGMTVNAPVQFVFASNNSPVVLDPFLENTFELGVEYYIKEILSDTEFKVSETVGGAEVTLEVGQGLIQVIGGDAIKDMFHMQNATGMRNMTLIGLLGTLTDENEFGTRRPTGPSYVSLDPGSGPGDTSVWISTRSPYIQNVTAFGVGCTAIKIDGTLHNGGNKSIVANDFTHIISDGIGVWCTGTGALTELVSIFSYYGYAGYFAEDGGRIRATNGNSSYGVFGTVAEGFDDTEVPITGIIYNRQYYPEPKILTVKGLSSATQKLRFDNAGKHYNRLVTNLLTYSNDFQTAPWNDDGFVSYFQNTSDPYDKTTLAWALTGTSATSGSGYIFQTINITPSGGIYTDVTGSNIVGNGNGATFTISVKASGYEIVSIGGTPFLGGQGYAEDDEILISGNQLGGINGLHDATIIVQTIIGNSIATATISGTIPPPTQQNYCFSVHVKPSLGNNQVHLAAEFSGSTPNEIRLKYDFTNFSITTTSVTTPVHVPTQYGIKEVDNGWYRIWFRTYDINALNNLATFKIYVKNYNSPAGGTTYFYGAQVENTPVETTPGFYLSTRNTKYSAYADFLPSGAGTNLETLGDEIRSNSIYTTTLVDLGPGFQIGGTGYQTASNNAQGGNTDYVILAGSDIASSSVYLGLRVILSSGTGVGQYGIITNYNTTSKYAHIAKESYDPVTVTGSDAATNKLLLSGTTDFNLLYAGMPVTFYPTVYSTTVTSASKTTVIVTNVVGGQSNTMTTAGLSQLYNNMPVSFQSTGIFGGVVSDFTYYIINLTETTFQLSTAIFGTPIFLVSGTGSMAMNIVSNTSYFYATSTANMTPNMSLQFTGGAIGGTSTGTVYYINDVIDSHFFSISTSLTQTTATAVSSGTNYITLDSTVGLVSLFPAIFHGVALDTIVAGNKYYISKIVDANTITISSTLNRTIARSTEEQSNIIKVDSTAGFVIGNPIKFVGTSFGGLLSDNIYYISRIISTTDIQISTSVVQVSITVTSVTGASNYISALTANLTELYPIKFTGTGLSGSNIVTGTTYYVSKIIDSSNFTIASSIISRTISGTTSGTNQITCNSTSGFQLNNPIIFYGLTIGGITAGTVYYIAQIDNLVTFRISASPGGGTLPLTSAAATTTIIANTTSSDVDLSDASVGTLTGLTVDTGTIVTLVSDTGYLTTETTGQDYTFISDTGTMELQSTPSKTNLITSSGSIIALFNSSFISGISPATTYYIETVDSLTSSITIEDSIGGTQVDVETSSYSMQMLVSGWDHFVPGADIEPLLDTTTQYFIEPRLVYSAPPFVQQVISFPTQTVPMTSIAYGDGNFIAITPGLNTLPISKDTVNWDSVSLPVTATWTAMAFGNGYWNLISSGGAAPSIVLYTTDPRTSWKQSTLPSVATWGSIVYGEGVFVVIDNGSNSNKAAYSLDYGKTWIASTLPSPNPSQWKSLTYGNGRFVALASNSLRTAISYDGQTWINGGNLHVSSNWSSIAFGNGRFIAVSSDASIKPAWSFDGLDWNESLYNVRATSITYGQGVFLAVRSGNTLAYTSEDGIVWKHRTVSAYNYSGVCFGYTSKNLGTVSDVTISTAGSNYSSAPTLRFVGGGASSQAVATCTIGPGGAVDSVSILSGGTGYTEPPTIIVTESLDGITASFTPQMTYELDKDSYTGLFVTVGSTSLATAISAGARTKARVEITSGIITDFYSWEPGSGYIDGFESLEIYDTNSTQIAQTALQIGNGVLGHPLIITPGIGYNFTTTDIVVNGDGYAEEFQAEYNLVIDAATAQPSVGSNLVIAGLSEIYKITDITVLDNSSAPNLRLRIGINPPLSALQSPLHATSLIIREKYSQVRLTGHDFLNIGFGDQFQSGYPGIPTDPDSFLRPFNQTIEVNYGRVFYTSTDQDGNFKVGNFFGVEQATGIVTLSASQFGLEGLTQLRLGGIAVGSQSVVITQISTDPSMIDNSDNIIVTQKAIRTYIANRLSQGGSNVVTSTMNAGTVVIGGQDFISSTVPAGQLNSSVRFSDKVIMEGPNAGVDGNMAAWFYYIGQGVWRQ